MGGLKPGRDHGVPSHVTLGRSRTACLATFCLSLALLVASPSARPDWERAKTWLGVYGGWIALDSVRHSHDDTNAGFGFGYAFTPRFSLDLEFESYNTHYDRDYLDSVGREGWNGENRVKDLQLMGRYRFRSGDFAPFVSFGAGLQRHRNIFDHGGDLTLSAGLGAHYRWNGWVAARVNAYYKVAFDDESIAGESHLADVIYRLDLLFHWGAND